MVAMLILAIVGLHRFANVIVTWGGIRAGLVCIAGCMATALWLEARNQR